MIVVNRYYCNLFLQFTISHVATSSLKCVFKQNSFCLIRVVFESLERLELTQRPNVQKRVFGFGYRQRYGDLNLNATLITRNSRKKQKNTVERKIFIKKKKPFFFFIRKNVLTV